MSAASIKASAAKKRSTSSANKNYSTSLAGGGSVKVVNGVKTYSDKGQEVKGKNGISISGKSYSRDKGGTGYAVAADQLGTTSPVIPNAPTPKDPGNMLGMNNASVLQEGLKLEGGQFVKDEAASDVMNATKEANMNLGNIANQMIGYLKPEDNRMENAYQDTYGISTKQAGRDFRGAQQEVQQYTSQLNNITASRDAAALSLEGQGRGQTQGFVGGEQARINREAAIQALPVQAQLAAAQGNLEIAKSHVDSLFQMKVKDIETEQAYKSTVANTWMTVANAQQQNLLSAAIADSNARAEEKKTAMNDAKQIAMQAIEYGQSSLASSVMKLDPTSATYQQDVMAAMGKLSKPVVAAKRETEMYGSKLIDSQTGEVIQDFGGDLAGGATADEMAYAQQYASTGQIPTGLSSAGVSFGRIQELAADLPKPNGALVSTPTGVAPSNLNDTQKAGIVAMSEIVNDILPNMQKLWDEAQRTNLGGTGIVGGIASKLIPTQAMTRYEQARDEFLSKLLVARSGAAVTEQEYQRYSALVPGSFNKSLFLGSGGETKLDGLQNLMTTDLDNKLNASGLSIYGYSKVKAGDDTYTVGEIVTNEYGQSGRINPDGSITLIN